MPSNGLNESLDAELPGIATVVRFQLQQVNGSILGFCMAIEDAKQLAEYIRRIALVARTATARSYPLGTK